MAKSCFLGLKRVPKVVLGPEKNFVPIGPKMAEIWPKLFSRPKTSPKSGFRPRKNFRPNWSKNGRNMAKSCFLGLKRVQKVVFRPRKFFRPNRSKNGQNMAKSCFLSLKQVPKVVLGLVKFFVPIGPKMAKIWPKVDF